MAPSKDKNRSKESKSPTSKGSKGKAEKGSSPPVETSMQTDPCTVCYSCGITFECPADVQAHTQLIKHEPNLILRCVQCKEILEAKWCPTHRCNMRKAMYLNLVTSSLSLKSGAPFRCLFCRSRAFESKSDLIVHLLGFHNSNRQPGHCALCNFTFQEPEPIKVDDLPPPPPDIDEATMTEFKAYKKANIEMRMCEPKEIEPGMIALDEHLLRCHANYYRFLARMRTKEDIELRAPFACTICGSMCGSNHEFQTHILCRHGVDACIKQDLCICGMCGLGVGTSGNFEIHCRDHSKELEHLANVWINNELMQESVSCDSVCTFCWETFKTDYALQAHIRLAHTGSSHALICGWCGEDFSNISDPLFAFQILINHEKNHALTLHATALEFKTTSEPLPERLSEDTSDEAMKAAQAAALGDLNGEISKSDKKSKSTDKKKSKLKSRK